MPKGGYSKLSSLVTPGVGAERHFSFLPYHESNVTEETKQESQEKPLSETNEGQGEEELKEVENTSEEGGEALVGEVPDSADSDTEEETDQDLQEEDGADSPDDDQEEESRKGRAHLPKVASELHRLVDLSTKYPEIGPIIAILAAKLGFTNISERAIRLGLESDGSTVEYAFVSAELARSEGRKEDVLDTVVTALRDVCTKLEQDRESLEQRDLARLLHIVRIGFATLMFDFDEMKSQKEFTDHLKELMTKLVDVYAEDPFFFQLYAQALWFSDEDASEEAWEKAVEYGEPEKIWNARGTWYKEASRNMTAAEAAYRRGLAKTSDSALLMHNLAQILMDRANSSIRLDVPHSAVLVNEAEGLLRKAKRAAHRQRMLTHVYETMDQLKLLKAKLNEFSATPAVGDVVTGRVTSLKPYGAFIVLPSGHTGLLHSSEIDHYWVEDATTRYNENDSVQVQIIQVENTRGGGFRISLSRKVLIEKPADFDESLAKPPQRSGGEREEGNNSTGRRGRKGRNSKPSNSRGKTEHSSSSRRNRSERSSTPTYKDSGTGATIAEILQAKLDKSSKEK